MSKESFTSIVVPVYNTAEHLEDCINSVLRQSDQSFELILVNDGSIDASGIICNKYAEQSSKIKVIHQENQGVTRARSVGVAHAIGAWIMFLDSDDTLRNDALSTMHQYISDDIDIIEAVFDSYTKKRGNVLLNPQEFRRMFLYEKMCINGLPCKLFRKELFDDFIFDVPRCVTLGEDFIANLRLSYRVQGKILLVDDVIYNYRMHAESASHSLKKTVGMQRIIFHELMKSIPKEDLQSREYIYKDALFHFCESICNKVRLSEEEHAFRKDLLHAPRSVFRCMLRGHLLTLMITNPLIRFAIRLGAIKR